MIDMSMLSKASGISLNVYYAFGSLQKRICLNPNLMGIFDLMFYVRNN